MESYLPLLRMDFRARCRTFLCVCTFLVVFMVPCPQGLPVNASKLLLKNDRDNVRNDKENDLPFPPDHIEGLKLERDGHLNQEFRKEVFLGNEHEDFENIPEKEGKERLKDIFQQVDTDGDKQIGLLELTDWISIKTEEHYKEAVEENEKTFFKFDPNQDGVISWAEYKIYFLKVKGYSQSLIEKVGDGESKLDLKDDDDYELYRDQDRWQQADENEDNSLTHEEFLAFKHPEHCRGMLRLLVEEILHDLDQDGDGILTVVEFVSLPIGHEKELERMAKEDEWVRERKKEFEQAIDVNQDGKVTVEELEVYMDPKSRHNAESEARHLMGVADINDDGRLSLKEVLINYDFFIGSKMFNYAKSVHDEF
ncbi:45 kDa calcium-binding protein-like [Saccoglossus kowalevskii]|uniref:45 kDa calcium-binding protein n=1 Tax=Saccoglossus kowalevskii TaxID=10224 RepID=A0ABM0GN57_SACKO|nr:PREDICTED: 45 kDa calcium-binding protein-like [Saccoglossus kowalevskii]